MRRITNSLVAFVLITVMAGYMIGCAGTESRRSTGEYIDDTAIATKIKSALATDPVADALDINVGIYKGRVQLSGFVETEEQAERAEEIAESIEGVESVENNIVVK